MSFIKSLFKKAVKKADAKNKKAEKEIQDSLQGILNACAALQMQASLPTPRPVRK